MNKKRNRYNPQEKARISLEAIRGELTLAQISSKYQVHATQINQWKKLALAHLPEAFSNTSKQVQTTHETELSALYEQVGRLKVENEFLKKKQALFK